MGRQDSVYPYNVADTSVLLEDSGVRHNDLVNRTDCGNRLSRSLYFFVKIEPERRQKQDRGGCVMSIINVKNLTFGYEGSADNVFENVSFQMDTSWRLGFTGRNGRGKTTFLKLLTGEYE